VHAINGDSNDWNDSTVSHFLQNERRLNRNVLPLLPPERKLQVLKWFCHFCVLFLVFNMLMMHCRVGEWVLLFLGMGTNCKCVAVVILTT